MNKLRFLALAALVISAFGCESVVDDLNVNPNEFTEVPATLIFQHAALNTAAVAEAEPARIAGMWSDQFAGTDRQYITQDRYEVSAATFDEVWSDLFQAGISQSQLAEQAAQAEGQDNLANFSRILQGYYAAEASLIFGDVPFSEVNNLEISDPRYEDQASVLNAGIGLLEAGISGSGSDVGVSAGNSIFNSSSTWAEFAQALRARYLLAQSDYDGALSAARAAGFEDASSSVDIIHTTTNFSENLFFQFEAEQRSDYLSFGNEGSVQSTLFNILQDTTAMSRADDKTDDSARFAYYSSGAQAGLYKLNVNPGGFFAADMDFPVIGFPEVQLIIAECAARTGDDEAAIAALNAARNYWDDLTGTDSYQDYDEDDFDDDDALLDAILTEKYVSVFGLPTFYDVIRTNNRLGADMDTRDTPAQRFLYPSTEISSNSNFPGVADLGTTNAVLNN